MKKGFTLIELLVVIAIMGILGTASVGGYRQMQRGMAERGVMENVNSFLRAAYERAQVDRRPTYVYFWNELLREETVDDSEIVVGHAVAVRGNGRISRIDGQLLIDEFGDLEQFDEDGDYAGVPEKDTEIRLYQLNSTNDKTPNYSLVYSIPVTSSGNKGGQVETYVTHDPAQDSADSSKNKGRIIQYGYKLANKKGVNWKVGSIYGLEFQTLTLPHGYVFGTDVPTKTGDPIGENVQGIVCTVGRGTEDGTAGTVTVYSRRPGASGEITSIRVDQSNDPSQE